jgi:hypothetical protein
MFSHLNDNDFVSQIERKFLSRKKTGGLLLVFSLVMVGAAGYFAYEHGRMLLRIADNISYIGAHSSDEALREEAKKTSAQLLLIQGSRLGFLLCAMITASVQSFARALYLIFGSRKERLLIEYNKRLRAIR